jgi:exopolyphosphatase/guanosine-5'-triphosphate,3'-diphosphate pyrophosphatase
MGVRVAAADIGTNTLVFLVAEKTSSGLTAVADGAEIVRLGEGVDRTGDLAPAAVERTLAALGTFVQNARALGVARLAAVGTQALREVRSGAAFVARASAILGGPVEIISGEREARLAWAATAAAFPLTDLVRQDGRTVVDIGGGSTELIVGRDAIDEVISLPIGSVRLTERLLHADPPSEEERRALVNLIDEALARAPAPRGAVIGVAGTVTTLCAIHLGLDSYDPARVHGATLHARDLDAIVDMLARTPLAGRRNIPGLDPRRADVIYAGAVILCRVLARANADRVTVSDRGIRWGLAAELAQM